MCNQMRVFIRQNMLEDYRGGGECIGYLEKESAQEDIEYPNIIEILIDIDENEIEFMEDRRVSIQRKSGFGGKGWE